MDQKIKCPYCGAEIIAGKHGFHLKNLRLPLENTSILNFKSTSIIEGEISYTP